MVTKNRRVAAYLPPHVNERFQEFKQKADIKGDSEAFIKIIMEYLGVEHPVTQQVSFTQFSELIQRLEALENKEFVEQRQLDALKADVTKDIALAISAQPKEKVKSPEKRPKAEVQVSTKEKPDSKGKDVAVVPVVKSGQNLNATDLAKRLGMGRTTVSNWKSDDPKRGKNPEQLLEITKKKDPDGIGWVFLKDKNVFAPEREIPSNPKIIQGEIGA